MTAGNGVDMWMPINRADGKENDWVQIGDTPWPRYISHIDYHHLGAAPGWGHTNTALSCRSTQFFYAKSNQVGEDINID